MTRVMFVDDEPMITSTIVRALRTRRPNWRISTSSSGPEALTALAGEPADIVVSDVAMPEMDGLTLLREVRARHPGTMRVVMSGNTANTEDPNMLAALHQWLAKPVPIAQLCEIIDRLCWAHALVTDAAELMSATQLASLPSPPAVYTQLVRAIQADASINQIASIISRDPAIAAKLLQLTNTAFFSESQPVTTVSRALALLGCARVRSIVLAAELFRSGASAESAVHAQRVSALAAVFAPNDLAPDTALAGLLHDCGSLICPRTPGDDPRTHARLGGVLLATWGLPLEIAGAAAYHHDPEAADAASSPVLAPVVLANACANELDDGVERPEVETWAARLALDPRECRRRAVEIARSVAHSSG